jgi:hypothetical protein
VADSKPQMWAWFASADLRHRAVYNYDKGAGEDERRQPSVNLAVGRRSDPTRRHAIGLREWYLRVYYGVNPHGQLRNQDDLFLIGVGFNFGQ